MKYVIKFNKPWYVHPVFYEGKWEKTITFGGTYNMKILENDNDSRFIYFESTFEGEDGKDVLCKMEVLKEVIEILGPLNEESIS